MRPSPHLRVLHLAKYAPPVRGGMETTTTELLAALADRDDVTVDCYCYADRSSEEQRSARVWLRRRRVTAVAASAPLSLALLVSYWRARREVDVVHVHLPNPWAALLAAWLATPAKVVVTWHGISTRYGHLRRWHNALNRRLLDRAAAIIVSMPANADVPELAPHADKIVVIPFGIDPGRLASSGEQDCDARPVDVLFVGRLVYYKGLDTLVAAAAQIDAQVVLLGDGPLYPRLRDSVATCGLEGRVRFLRDADDAQLGDHIRRARVLVLPSDTTSESFGLSVLEAMALAKPVVVTRLGTGLDETVRTADCGLIVAPRDPADLAAAITTLLGDPEQRIRLGRNGLRAFEENYTASLMADRLMQLYRAVTTPPPATQVGG